MKEVIGILAGALLSGAASLSIGTILFRRLAIQMERTEYLSLAFVTGSACFSQIVFVLASIHLARRGVFLAVGLLAVGVACGLSRRIPVRVAFTLLARRWEWFCGAIFAPFAIVYLVNAMAPEMSPDGAAYHLPFVATYLRAHGFERISGDFYASLSQGVDLLFLPAVSLGGNSSAAITHFLFLLDLPLMMICYGRRFGFPIPAAAAGFLVFASPLMGWDGTSAYVDIAAAAVLFAVFYLLQVWDGAREPNLLILTGILAGFSYAAKYTAAIAIPYALGFVIWRLWRGGKPLLKPVVTICAFASLFVLPWLIRNAAFAGNPFAPFANHLFPNPYVHVSFEREYRSYLRHYRLVSWFRAPWELAVKGERLQGFFGPVFLLMPLAVLSLRRRAGRRLLLAGAVFGIPWFLNIGSRFLIPALPPLAIALTLAMERAPGMVPAIMVLHGVLSWYASPVAYFDRHAPRIAAFPLRAALRMENEETYLARGNPGYLIDRMIERYVPPVGKVFSLQPVPKAWTTREIVAGQNGAENEVVADILRTALVSFACPMRALDFRFPPILLRGMRIIQTARLSDTMWSVSELQMLQGGKALSPDRNWRLNGSPNPWDARLAFDGSMVTRWRSWEDARPGMFLEAAFEEPKLLDGVRLLTVSDDGRKSISLRGMGVDGKWRELSAALSTAPAGVAGNLRAQAVRELLARGIHYLLVTPGAFGANDFDENAAAWGLRMAAESGGARLYYLEPDRAALESAGPISASQEAAAPPGVYDDTDPRICLGGPWIRDPQFQEASHHTLTYSDILGASASLVFAGSAVTYLYTRASNRGIVEVSIDGQVKDQIDLYAAETLWQSHKKYEGLGPGRHVIQIRVTGRRNPQSAGRYVDLDELVVE
jgi:hypothetical protein